MKFPLLAQLGLIGGIGLTILSAIRYWILFPDMDRAIIYVLVGFGLIAGSLVYKMVRDHCDEIEKLNFNLEAHEKRQFEFEGWVNNKLNSGEVQDES